MTCTRLQTYTNTMVGGHGILRYYEVVVVVLLPLLSSFDAFIPTSAQSILFLDKRAVLIYI